MPNHQFLLDCEAADDYDQFRAGIINACSPEDDFESLLVEHLIDAAWEVRRWRSNSARFWDYVGGHYNRAHEGIAEALFHCPENHFRAERCNRGDAMQTYYRALDRWTNARRNRDSEPPPKKSGERPPAWLNRLKEIAVAAGSGSSIASDKMLSSNAKASVKKSR